MAKQGPMSVSAWPTAPVEEPRLLLRQQESVLVEVDDEPVVLQRGTVTTAPWAEFAKDGDGWVGELLPPEFYLWELFDLDLDDPEDVLAFVQQWGPVQMEHMGSHFLEGSEHRALTASRTARFDQIRQACRDQGLRGEPLPVEEVRVVLRKLRDTVRAFLVNADAIEEKDLIEHWSTWHGPERDLVVDPQWRSRSREFALREALAVVNSGLYPFAPRIVMGERNASQVVLSSIYNDMCLALFNDVARGSAFRHCERCDRIFVRQRGRAGAFQHRRRGEVKYCSAKCMNAAMAKAHRDRKRQEGAR